MTTYISDARNTSLAQILKSMPSGREEMKTFRYTKSIMFWVIYILVYINFDNGNYTLVWAGIYKFGEIR